jgi:hypothetical protein
LDVISTPDLPFNICRLESSYILDKDDLGLAERVDQLISTELFYACQYWGSHLGLADGSADAFSALYAFILTRLLLWMEVMSLMRRIHVGVAVLTQAQSWSKVGAFYVDECFGV